MTVVGFGILLIWWAWRSDLLWFERHVLPNYCVSSDRDLRAVSTLRWAGATAGAILVFGAGPFLGRWTARRTTRELVFFAVVCTIAVVAALVASEILMRRIYADAMAKRDGWIRDVPAYRCGDPNYACGWAAPQTKDVTVASRPVTYAINAEGNRARTAAEVSDPSLPTILVVGESIGFGHAVRYEESFAGLLEHDLGIQTVNLSVSGFGPTQQYMRLLEVLPRYTNPVVVVIVFVPMGIPRDNFVDRPHMELRNDGTLELLPATTGLKIALMVNNEPYRGNGPLETTRAVLRATAAAVRARGARPLFLITNFGPACLPDEGLSTPWFVHELFEREALPYVLVQYGADETPTEIEIHPNAAVHRRFADAIERALRVPER